MVANTPGVAGYLLAWLVSAVAFSAGLTAPAVSSPAELAFGTLIWLPIVWVFSVPFGLAGMAAVHIVCSDVRAQWVHVAVAGLAGAVAGSFFALSLFFGWYPVIGYVAAATALGRLAVVPMVWWRRRDSARPAARC